MESAKSSKSTVSECERLSLQTEQMAELVCPVCFDYMKPPIMGCEKQHWICDLCHELSSKCPLCQSELTTRRNSHLEVLATLLLFPCKQCHKRFSLEELPSHKCSKQNEDLNQKCLIGQVHGNCNWIGTPKEMMEHINLVHPNNYWTKKENLAKWNYCCISNIGIQQIYVVDLIEAIFIFLQKYDSNTQSLQWTVSCECEKESSSFVYEIQLYSEYKLETLKCRTNIENNDKIFLSLPNSNEIVIPINKVTEFLGDNNYVNYKVIIYNKSDVQNDQQYNCSRTFEENTNFVFEMNEVKQSCTQRSWQSIVGFYNYIKTQFC